MCYVTKDVSQGRTVAGSSRVSPAVLLSALVSLGLLLVPSFGWAEDVGESVSDLSESRESAPGDEGETGAGGAVEPERVVTVLPPGEGSEPESMPEDQFQLEVLSLEERVTDLKEQVFQTKARLMLLQETIIGGDLSTGARAVITHRNEMGASFILESATIILDGAPIFSRVDQSGDLDRQKEIEIFSGRILPGTHQLGVRLVFRGSGYGVFSYLNDYRFRVQSSHTFDAEGGKVTRIDIVSFERGGLTTELQDRPSIRYEEEIGRDLPGATTQSVKAEDSP